MVTPESARLDALIATAIRVFGRAGAAVRAPGRVNLIGDHTDYQQGFVLPIAIANDAWAIGTRRDDLQISVYSVEIGERFDIALGELEPRACPAWARYPVGVAWALREAGCRVGGTEITLQSTVPIGAGLSSSAAIEVATALAIARSHEFSVAPLALARLCQRAENEFAGVACGIMDQYVAAQAVAGSALLIDCRDLSHETVPVPAEAVFVVAESGVKHALASSGYNQRRSAVEQAVTKLRTRWPRLESLRDLALDQLAEAQSLLNAAETPLVRHIVSENARVVAAAAALKAGNLVRFGALMNESHASLRDDYQASAPELDILVESAAAAGAIGSRMTGGGWGGATVSLLRPGQVAQFMGHVGNRYRRETGRSAEFFVCHPSAGAGDVAIASQGPGFERQQTRLADGRYLIYYHFPPG